MRKPIVLVVLAGLCFLGWVDAGRAAEEAPRWSFSLRGGYWRPEVDGWQDHYGSDGLGIYGVEGGYKLTRRLEIGLSVDYAQDKGRGITLSGRSTAEEVTYREVPVNLSLLYRLIFAEDQLLVPYLGGGYSYVYYRQEFGDAQIDGDRHGYHARAGVQILLDGIDPSRAWTMRENWGVSNTYLTVEALYTSLDDFGKEEVDLGGTTLVGSVMFEF